MSAKIVSIVIMFVILVHPAVAMDSKNVSITRDRTKLKVMIDPRVELLSVIFHLAGNPAYNICKSKPYIRNLKKHFAEFRNHAAIEMAKKLRETRGIGADAVMNMAIHIKDIDTCDEIVPFIPRPSTLDGRWQIDEARDFLRLCRDFVKETDFKTFLEKSKPIHDNTVEGLQHLIDTRLDQNWFDAFFGERDDVHLNLIVSVLNGPCNYGSRVNFDGMTEIFSIIGVWQIKWFGWGNPTFDSIVVSTVVHEFSHSYCNPLVDEYMEFFRPFGEKYFPQVESRMRSNGYGSWQTMMYESLVRACEVRYAMANDSRKEAARVANQQIRLGFQWTGALSDLLGQYENQRDTYKTLGAFMPEIVRMFQNYN